MTHEQKDLLFKDLCARLPYGVKCEVYNCIGVLDEVTTLYGVGVTYSNGQDTTCRIDECKPYLFPLSSMTDEQCEELRNLIYEHFTLDDEFNEGICFKTYGDILVWLDEKPINQCYFIFDYFNKNHFDYRGLIPMGLANDCTNLKIY